MSIFEKAYLAMVILGMASFVAALGWATWYVNRKPALKSVKANAPTTAAPAKVAA